MKKIKIASINAELEVKSYIEENTFVRFILWDPDSGDALTEQGHFNWGRNGYAHPFVKFSAWAKKSGWTHAYNLDFRIHDLALKALVEEDYVPQEALDFALRHPKDNPQKGNGGSTAQASKQTTQKATAAPKQTQAQSTPKPQREVGDIMKSKVKVSQATPKPKAEQPKTTTPKFSGFKKMSEEELAKELEFIVDNPNMNHDVDEDLLT